MSRSHRARHFVVDRKSLDRIRLRMIDRFDLVDSFSIR